MQAGWTGGYSADLPYIPTYVEAQAPATMAMVCALAGVHCSLPRDDLALLDLGCGRGMGALALAAANPGWSVTGIDYMPAHVAEAREIAAAAGLDNARFLEEDIADLDAAAAARLLPELDVITMHGVWSWVGDPVRAGILRLIRSRLKPGGLVLVTYNGMPGWVEDLALRRLLVELVARLDGPVDQRMAEAIDHARRLAAAGAAALAHSPFLQRYERVPPGARRAYVRYAVHEFLPAHWQPFYPQAVARAFAEAKLDPIGPAALPLHMPDLILRPVEREAVASLPPGLDRSFARDLCTRPTLRQDLFIRGRRPAEAESAIRDLTLALRRLPADGQVVLDTPTGQASLPAPAIGAALGALAAGARTVDALLALPELAPIRPDELLVVLAGSEVAAPAWRAAPPSAMQARAQRFNRVLLRRLAADVVATGGELAAAAPMLGAGLSCGPVELATLLALHEAAAAGRPPPDAPAIARAVLAEGSAPEAVAWTEQTVRKALAERLPAWRALGLM